MFKTLRRRFIRLTMLSVIAVLVLLIGSINLFNYRSAVNTADSKLELLLENGGRFPDGPGQMQGAFPEDGMPPDGEAPPGNTDDAGDADAWIRSRDRINHGNGFFGNVINDETPFSTRFFTVDLTADGEVSRVSVDRIAAIDEDEAEDYAEDLSERFGTADAKAKNGGRYGFADEYRYVYRLDEDGQATVIFVDASQELYSFRTFLYASILVSLAGLLLVFLIVLYFSGKIVAPMAESYEKQKLFITDASHELKTPLSVISANTEVIEMVQGENEWTKSIRRQIGRMSSLIEKLVYLSRMDEEQPRLAIEHLDLSALVEETADSFDAVAQARNRTLQTQIDPGIFLDAEEKSMVQLLSLLLDNAMKYSDDGGMIQVALHEIGREKVLTVYNTVDDIPKGNLDRLFERFYRLDSSRSTKTGGYGIGLSVAAAIVHAHKGTITAESKDGKSILFTVKLP